MNKRFVEELEEYLSHEINDYGLNYTWEWCEDTACCVVTIFSNIEPNNNTDINFRFDGVDLKIELSEDSFYVTRWHDKTVKYLWMLVGAKLMSKYF